MQLRMLLISKIRNKKKCWCNVFEEVRENRIKCICAGVGLRQEYR